MVADALVVLIVLLPVGLDSREQKSLKASRDPPILVFCLAWSCEGFECL